MNTAYLENHVPTGTISVVVPLDKGIIELSYFQACTMGVCEAAELAGLEVLLVYSDYRDLKHLRNLISGHKIDGVIITRTYHDDFAVAYLKKEGIPFVTLGCVPDADVVQVDNDHEEACKELTMMSIMKGRRKIAFLSSHDQNVVNGRRFEGYSEALRYSGRKIDPRIIFHDVDSQTQAEQIVDELLGFGVDSIICNDEVISFWAYTKLKKEGIDIPGQVELSSCYHSNALENYVPSITTIKYDAKLLGSTACVILSDILAGKEVPKKTFLSYGFNIKKASP